MADQSVSPSQFYTTLHEYLRQVSDLTLRSFQLLDRITKRKGVSYNHNGDRCQWPLKIALPTVHPYTGGTLQFDESDKHREMDLPWRMFYAADGLDELTRLQNRGEAAIIRRQDKVTDDIRQALQNKLAWSIYCDGYVSIGYPHGLESFLAVKAGTVVADRIGQPDDDYASIATDLFSEGGTWDAAGATPPNTTLGYEWPNGSGDTEADCTSPKLLNITSTSWTAGTNNVDDNIEECISQAVTWLRLLGGPDAMPDLCMLSADYFEIYKAVQRAKQTINVPWAPGQDVGFKGDGFNQDGVFVTTEYGVPQTRGYIINSSKVELRCMYEQLFKAKGPDEDLRGLTMLWAAVFAGQWCFEPKNVAKLYPYAAQ
jgi:hypothetical protein